MIYDMKYRIDILTQISALTSALQVVAVGLLNEHLKHCVVDIKIKEATDAIARLVRC
jgi:DNA-binding FrmR family transcriptional regulator